MGHDHFLKRIIDKQPITDDKKQFLSELGNTYLTQLSEMSDELKSMCLVSSEDGGSKAIYQQMIKSPEECWTSPTMKAFKHFLNKHIAFDSNEGDSCGHGALVRKLGINDDVTPMLKMFADCLEKAISYDNRQEQAIYSSLIAE